jgi:hypothetical protein
MRSPSEAEQVKRAPAELSLYSGRAGVAVSLVISLAVIAILSKNRVDLWLLSPALTVPVFLALYFRNRMALLGPLVYAAGLIAILVVAILFGL